MSSENSKSDSQPAEETAQNIAESAFITALNAAVMPVINQFFPDDNKKEHTQRCVIIMALDKNAAGTGATYKNYGIIIGSQVLMIEMVAANVKDENSIGEIIQAGIGKHIFEDMFKG